MCEPTDAPAAKITQKKLLLKFLLDHQSDIKSQLPPTEMSRLGQVLFSPLTDLYITLKPRAKLLQQCRITLEHSGRVSVQSLAHPCPSPVLLCQDSAPEHSPSCCVPTAPAHTRFPAANPLIRPQNPHGEPQLFSLISYNGSFSLSPISKEGGKALQDCLGLQAWLGQASRLSSQIKYGNKNGLCHKTLPRGGWRYHL